MNDTIAQSLGLSIVPKTEKTIEVITPETNETTSDFNEARDTIKDTIEKADGALDEMIEIAQSSQHHLAYQAVNALLKTKLDAARELLALQKEKRTIKKMDSFGQDLNPAQVTHNNLFVGTTQEMLNLIEKARDSQK